MMANYFRIGADDAKRATFYGDGLPLGTVANSETRSTYRAGWIANRAKRGMENLPACFMSLGNRHYWIVSVDHDGKPIYNCTNGEAPSNDAGYRDIGALMDLKGDCYE